MYIEKMGGVDPWTLGEVLSGEPRIDPTSVVRKSELGCYTYLGPRTQMADSVFGDYSYAMGDNQIAHACIGKFVNIATCARINPPNHPTWRAAALHHFTYRSRSYGLSLESSPVAGLPISTRHRSGRPFPHCHQNPSGNSAANSSSNGSGLWSDTSSSA